MKYAPPPKKKLKLGLGRNSLQSCPWVGLTHELGWYFSVFVGLGWVHYSKVLKICKNYVNAFKPELDRIWLHRAVTVSLTLRPISQ